MPLAFHSWHSRLKLGVLIGAILALGFVGERMLNDYLVRWAGVPISVDLARESITPHLRAASLRWQEMTFQPNTASPPDVIVRFKGLERMHEAGNPDVWHPVDGFLNLRTLDGNLWRATGLDGLRGVVFSFSLDSPQIETRSGW